MQRQSRLLKKITPKIMNALLENDSTTRTFRADAIDHWLARSEAATG